MSSGIPPESRDEIALVVKFWNQTEGRDKLTKLLQYGCRALSWYFADDVLLSKKLTTLYKTSADSRKIFRLGKALNEYQKLKQLIDVGGANGGKSGAQKLGSGSGGVTVQHHRTEFLRFTTADQIEGALTSLSRLGFLFYWVYDNMNILIKLGVLTPPTPSVAPPSSTGGGGGQKGPPSNSKDLKKLFTSSNTSISKPWDVAKKAFFCWWIGLLFGIFTELYKLQRNLSKAGRLEGGGGSPRQHTGNGGGGDRKGGRSDVFEKNEYQRMQHSPSPLPPANTSNSTSPPSDPSSSPSQQQQQQLVQLSSERKTIYQNLLKNLGDFVTASNGIDLPARLLGRGLNDGIVGLSGFISAAITCYQLYPRK